jgi:hypothetical protein
MIHLHMHMHMMHIGKDDDYSDGGNYDDGGGDGDVAICVYEPSTKRTLVSTL